MKKRKNPIVSDAVYKPREDSFLLQKIVENYAAGKVLEIGIGSGLQVLTAANMVAVDSCIGVDINPKAINHTKRKLREKIKNNVIDNGKVDIIKSDLFSALENDLEFDTIIFNPPYLPNDSRIKDVALDGGKKGYEITQRFLLQVNNYLAPTGIILLLISSLTKKDKVEEFIEYNSFTYSIIAQEEQQDGEVLYVYKIEKSLILRDLENKGVENIKRFAHGKRGIILTGEYKGEKIAIKYKRPDSMAENSIQNESDVLDYFLNEGFEFIPSVVFTGPDYFAYEFIEGQRIIDFVENAKKKDVMHVLKKVYDYMYELDKHGFTKEEMHHPLKHILINEKTMDIKLIDFERCKRNDKPKNVTQFSQFLISSEFNSLLKRKRIKIDPEELKKLAISYKRNKLSKNVFEKIKGLIK